MGDYCYGASFLKRGNNTCAALSKDCVYVSCRDQSGDHCYATQGAAVDRPYNITNSAYTCAQYCPAAYESYVPMNWTECRTDPDLVYSCSGPEPDTCQCYDVRRLNIVLPTTSSTTPSPTGASTTPSPSGTSITQPSSHLSTAAKAGVAVGATLAGLALFGLLAWRCLKGRQRQSEAMQELPAVSAPLPFTPALPPPPPAHTNQEYAQEKSEARYEVDTNAMQHGYAELASPDVRAGKWGVDKF